MVFFLKAYKCVLQMLRRRKKYMNFFVKKVRPQTCRATAHSMLLQLCESEWLYTSSFSEIGSTYKKHEYTIEMRKN